jgi:hypothetical protein
MTTVFELPVFINNTYREMTKYVPIIVTRFLTVVAEHHNLIVHLPLAQEKKKSFHKISVKCYHESLLGIDG